MSWCTDQPVTERIRVESLQTEVVPLFFSGRSGESPVSHGCVSLNWSTIMRSVRCNYVQAKEPQFVWSRASRTHEQRIRPRSTLFSYFRKALEIHFLTINLRSSGTWFSLTGTDLSNFSSSFAPAHSLFQSIRWGCGKRTRKITMVWLRYSADAIQKSSHVI